MSGHRVELHVQFFVGADKEGGEAAERLLGSLEYVLKQWNRNSEDGSDFTVWRGCVDGNEWPGEWLPKPVPRLFRKDDTVIVDAPDTFFHNMLGTVASVEGDTVWATLPECFSRTRHEATVFPMRFSPEELRHV